MWYCGSSRETKRTSPGSVISLSKIGCPDPSVETDADEVLDVLQDREISSEVIQRFQLGCDICHWFPPIWVDGERIFPCHDALVIPFFEDGHVVHVQWRTFKEQWSVKQKFFHQRGPASLWNADILKEVKGQDLFICEGPMDALCVISSGFENVIAIPSSSFCKSEAVQRVIDSGAKRIFLCFDNDVAGDKAFQRWQKALDNCAYEFRLEDGCKDLTEYVMKVGPEGLKEIVAEVDIHRSYDSNPSGP